MAEKETKVIEIEQKFADVDFFRDGVPQAIEQPGKEYSFKPDDLLLYRVEEITYEDDSPRLEALENVFSCMARPGVNFVYLIRGGETGVRFYFGFMRDYSIPKSDRVTDSIADVARAFLKPALEGNFRGSIIQEVSKKDSAAIQKDLVSCLETKERCLVMSGVPGIVQEKEKQDFRGIDRLVDVMQGDDFGFMVIAKAMDIEKVKEIHRDVFKVYEAFAPLVKVQKQEGGSKGATTGTGKHHDETAQEGGGESGGTNRNEQKNKGRNGEHWSEGTVTGGGSHKDWQKNWGRSISDGTNSHKDFSASSDWHVSRELTNKYAEDWVKYFDDVLIPRLDYGRGKGVFTVSTLLFGSTRETVVKLSNAARSIFSGDKANMVPLTTRLAGPNERQFVGALQLVDYKYPVAAAPLVPYCEALLAERPGTVGNWMTSRELAMMAGLPQKEVIGLRLKEEVEFGLNVPAADTTKWELLGEKCNWQVQSRFPSAEINCVGIKTKIPIKRQVCVEAKISNEWRTIASKYAEGSFCVVLCDSVRTSEVRVLIDADEAPSVEGVYVQKIAENEGERNVGVIGIGNLVKSGNVCENVPIPLRRDQLDRHIFIAGVTGCGKTTTCQNILLGSEWPFLVIEPAKTEYRGLRNKACRDLLVFTLGNDAVAPFRLNPFEFIKGESITSRVDMLMASISAAFDMEAAIPQLIERAIYACYADMGWSVKDNLNRFYDDPFADKVFAFPTLSDVLAKTEKVVDEQGFDDRLKRDYIGSIKARLQGLTLGAKGLMLDCRRSVDFDKLLDRKVVLELEDIPNGQQKSLIIGFILTNLIQVIKSRYERTGGKKVCHITLIEEAHRLLTKPEPGGSSSQRQAAETFADMLAEVRKYGESLIIADQIPGKLTPEVIKNTNTKIIHRLFAQDDKEAVGHTMGLEDEQIEFLSNLKVGHAVVFNGAWSTKPVQVKINELHETDSAIVADEKEKIREAALAFYKENLARGELTEYSAVVEGSRRESEDLLWLLGHDKELKAEIEFLKGKSVALECLRNVCARFGRDKVLRIVAKNNWDESYLDDVVRSLGKVMAEIPDVTALMKLRQTYKQNKQKERK